jgi:hypothetical protein
MGKDGGLGEVKKNRSKQALNEKPVADEGMIERVKVKRDVSKGGRPFSLRFAFHRVHESHDNHIT